MHSFTSTPGGSVLGIACLAVALSASMCRAQLQGTVQQLSFQGPITGGPVNYSIYLPQGYAAGGSNLPVIYHLHGIGGSSGGDQLNTVPRSYEAARAAGLIGPAIIVFANGYGDSFWADSVNSNKPAETNVVRELIPYIDANYRTVAARGGRVIQGFSMGGFGTEKFAAKFPDLFGVSVSYDGALLPWSTVQTRHPVQAAEIFNNSLATFNEYSPWFWSQQNAGMLATDTAFRMVVGAIVNDNRTFRNHLLAQGIAVEYVETGLPHALGAILTAQGANSWAFIQQHLCLLSVSGNPMSTATCPSGTVEFSVAAAGTGPFTYQWQWQPSSGGTWVNIVDGLSTDPFGSAKGFNAAGASTGTLTVSSARGGPGTAGTQWEYRCIVSAACSSVTSGTAMLSLAVRCSLADIVGTHSTSPGGPIICGDAVVDGSDFIAFINSFSTNDPAVDPLADVAGGGDDGLSPDGMLDGNDFIAFINAFAIGC